MLRQATFARFERREARNSSRESANRADWKPAARARVQRSDPPALRPSMADGGRPHRGIMPVIKGTRRCLSAGQAHQGVWTRRIPGTKRLDSIL